MGQDNLVAVEANYPVGDFVQRTTQELKGASKRVRMKGGHPGSLTANS